MVQIAGLRLVKLTASPESAVATSVGLVPSTCGPGLAKVIACAVLSTVKLRVTCAAAAKVALPA